LQRLNHLVAQVAAQRSQRYQGRVEEILIEGVNPKDATQGMGRTRTNRLTFVAGETQLGRLVPVRITETRAFSLTGVPLAA